MTGANAGDGGMAMHGEAAHSDAPGATTAAELAESMTNEPLSFRSNIDDAGTGYRPGTARPPTKRSRSPSAS